MSSPLASLGKLRKVSLLLPELQEHSKRAVCIKDDCYTDDEAALLSEILPPLSWSHTSISSSSSLSSRSKAKDLAPADSELMSTMMKRLTEIEQRVRTQAQEISKKNQKIALLEEKLSVLQVSNKIADEPKRQQELDKYLQLQNQVWEMEKFLNDYGMIWVGAEKDETSNVYLKEEEDPQELPDPRGPLLDPDDRDHDPATRESNKHQPQQSGVTDSGDSGSQPIALQPRQASQRSDVPPRRSQNDLEMNVIQDAQSSFLPSGYPSLEEPVIRGIQKLEHNMNTVIQEVSSTLTSLSITLGQILRSPAVADRVDKNKSSSIRDPSPLEQF